MFRGSYQKKLLTILYSGGSNPLEIWDIQVKNGWTRRVKDDELRCIVFEICGTNVATAYVVTPPDPRAVLGISLPFIIMFIKNLKRYFTFEIQIIDDKQMRRRFRFSNYQSSTKVRPFICSVPLALKPGWNQMQLNLANFTTRAYGTNYVETQRVQIHANCRIRRVYFSDRLYTEEELPREYRIHLNMRQVAQQKEQDEKKEEVVESRTSLPPSILKQKSISIQEKTSELIAETNLRSSSITSTAKSKVEGKGSATVSIAAEDQAGVEMTGSVHSIGSRKSERASKVEERKSMSMIAEELQASGVVAGEGEEAEGVEGEVSPRGDEDIEPEAQAEGEGYLSEESPRAEEEGESPRSDMAESEPVPESDAETAESPNPPPSPEPEEPTTE